jgi:hypothetical protein
MVAESEREAAGVYGWLQYWETTMCSKGRAEWFPLPVQGWESDAALDELQRLEDEACKARCAARTDGPGCILFPDEGQGACFDLWGYFDGGR